MKTIRTAPLIAFAALLLAVSAAESRVALFLQRTYGDGGAKAREAGIILQHLTPILDLGGVNWRVYYVEDFGAAYAAQATYLCDQLDDVDDVTVGVFVGGTHNDVGRAWAPEITQNGNGFSPDYPMIWVTIDASARMNFPSSGSTDIRTGSGGTQGGLTTPRIMGEATTSGFSTSAATLPTLDADITAWLGHVDVIAYTPGDTTRMWAWRTTSDTTAAHANGWTYIAAPGLTYPTAGPFHAMLGGAGALDNVHGMVGFMVAAEIARQSPAEWRRDRPIYWNIEVDDELAAHGGTNLVDSRTYSLAGTDRDWYNTPGLVQLYDSLAVWGDVVMTFGTNPDSLLTAEGVAKRAIWNATENVGIYHAVHNHGTAREINKQTTVAAATAMAADQFGNLRAYLDDSLDMMWSTGGQQSANFSTVMTMDSVLYSLSLEDVWIQRATISSVSSALIATRTDPKTNPWLRRSYDGRVCYWYGWQGQSSTDTTRYGAGSYTDAAAKHLQIINGAHLYRYSVVTHTPSFSFGRGVSPAVPAGLIWVQQMRAMKRLVNSMAGREMVAFGTPEGLVQNYWHRPRPQRW